MAPFEMYANATEQPDFVYENLQPDIHSVPALTGTKKFRSIVVQCSSNVFSNVVLWNKYNNNFGGVVPGFVEPPGNLGSCPPFCPPDRFILSSESPVYINGSNGGQADSVFEDLFRESSFQEQWSYTLMETEPDSGYSTLSASSFEYVQVPDSTLTSGPTITSSRYQEVDSAEDLNTSLEVITSWASPKLYPENEEHSFIRAASHQSRFKGVTKKEVTTKSKRGVDSNKYPCEIRISKKIQNEGKYKKGKVWLGTFATPDERGRALDVGKYYLCTRKNKTFYDPNSEAILSAFEHHLREQPLTELVGKVKKLAKHYGQKGSLPQSLNSM